MEHILNIDECKEKIYPIFEKIRDNNAILFLGAGASVGEKKYLSKEIIQHYEEKIGKRIGEENITKWIDILSANPDFSRSDFDHFVNSLLKKLSITDAHKIMCCVPWREIITTNYDLLVERAYDETSNDSSNIYDLKVVRNIEQYNYLESNTEIKYIKLNGCISDKGLYPLAFSSEDFNSLKPFYKAVLNDLKNVSPKIAFISIGYSYSDDFGKELLAKFDSYNYRDRKWMINIDPYPNMDSLNYYTQQRIQIIRCSFSDFFAKYKEWEDGNNAIIVKKKGLSIRSHNNSLLTVPSKLLLQLDGLVRQLNSQCKDNYFMKDSEFYLGEEPTFNIIIRNLDVIKAKYLTNFTERILKTEKGTLIPIFFITGDFGIGKSTFSLRLIYELEKMEELELIAFEIIDFNRMKKEFLIELVKTCKSKNIVFFCDEIEIDSYYKSLIELRNELSIEQFQHSNVFFIAPIRANILAKHKQTRNVSNTYDLNLQGAFEESEVDELLEKLKQAELIKFRDLNEKAQIKKKVLKEYNADSFISLMSLITSGKHEADLISCYNELSEHAKKAFLLTALLHKYKLLMPASWLKQNISMDWNEFEEKVVKAEGKGILIQEIVKSNGTQPDLYFRTKHPLIAERLVDKFMPSKDKQFTTYDRMLRVIEPSITNSYLVNNLLKAFIRGNVFNSQQINKLFVAANTKLSEDPYFLFNFAMNLQKQWTIESIKKGISLLLYAESLLEKRNHRFIHRRACLNFDLAKLYNENGHQSYVQFYLDEAKDLFTVKQRLDPCSAYSYVDYIKLLIWELNNLALEEEETLEIQIKVEWLFEYANSTVTSNLESISKLHTDYAGYISKISEDSDYSVYLSNLYDDVTLRPYACILLCNFYLQREEYDIYKEYIHEMEDLYIDNHEIIKYLFHYYGAHLYIPEIRVKLLQLARENPNLEEEMPFRYNFYNFISEFYNNNYSEGKKFLSNLRNKYTINPTFHYIWSDSDGKEMAFNAKIRESYNGFKEIKISTMQLKVRLIKGDYSKYSIGDAVKVKLHFYMYGLLAEII